MIASLFDDIKKTHVANLVEQEVPEGRTLEYKSDLPSNSDEDKKEFLADVSAFANAGGGDILFGITETRDAAGKATGIPDTAAGLAMGNVDAEKLRLENILRDGIAPRVSVRIQAVHGFAKGPVLHIRVPPSWLGPHQVIFKSASRFFTRTSAGKHQTGTSAKGEWLGIATHDGDGITRSGHGGR